MAIARILYLAYGLVAMTRERLVLGEYDKLFMNTDHKYTQKICMEYYSYINNYKCLWSYP
jgi:hypothetical protein